MPVVLKKSRRRQPLARNWGSQPYESDDPPKYGAWSNAEGLRFRTPDESGARREAFGLAGLFAQPLHALRVNTLEMAAHVSFGGTVSDRLFRAARVHAVLCRRRARQRCLDRGRRRRILDLHA